LVRDEPPPLLFIGLSTDVKRSETPREWPLGPMGKHHVEAPEWGGGLNVGSADVDGENPST
jgi:hypothetical protein